MQRPPTDNIDQTVTGSERPPALKAQQTDPYIGKVISDKYEVQSLIGRGGMGAVYKVLHRQLKKTLALKLLPLGDGLDRVDVARFDAEAKAASILNHPNLAGIHDYGTTDDGSPYLVMDFIDGKPLSETIKDTGPLSQEEAIELGLQICAGLEVAHSKRIVHRDIKPSNIMVSRDGGKVHARIVDFGIAKKLPAGDDRTPTLTQTGEIIGSPQYMSPEQCLGHKLDERSDIYSLGCVMFEMLTGKPPFKADNSVQLIFKHVNERAPLFKAVFPDGKINTALERIVLQALEKEADNRYQRISDLKRDIELVKLGKNPVKEVSRLRNNLRAFAKTVKVVLSGLGLCAVVVFLVYEGMWFFGGSWRRLESAALVQTQNFNYRQAEALYRQAYQAAVKENAPANDRERILFRLAIVYDQTRNPVGAIRVLKEALNISSTHQEDEFRGSEYDELAQAYLDNDQPQEAEAAARTAVDIKKRKLANHYLTGHSIARLATALRRQRKLPEAEQEAREYVAFEEKIHPKSDDPEVAQSYQALTYILADEGAKTKDLQMVNESISTGKKTLQLYLSILGQENKTTRIYARWFVDYLKYWHHDEEAHEVANQAAVPFDKPGRSSK